jgi:hypothetical protein
MAYTNIDDPSAYFQTATYTGNGTTTNNVTNTGNSNLQPDWVWIKQRSATQDHVVTDSSRDGEVASGTNLVLTPNTTEAEASSTGFGINYATNGINFDAAWAKVNASGQTYVAWQWKANGGTTSTNTDGSINTTVQANTDAGFSIVGYTCPDPITNFTIGHGLGVTPDVIIVKTRDGSRNWGVYHKSLTAPAENRNLKLNLTNAEAAESTFWANTAPTSSVITIAQNASVNFQGHNYIAYCFAEKQGYSKFGKYVGNGSNTNGTFIYTGFKPAFIMAKRTDANAHNWFIWDTKRAPSNRVEAVLKPNSSAVESSLFQIDILSNGFKHYNNYGSTNESGASYIYMAFAEHPFVTSTGIPTTAR